MRIVQSTWSRFWHFDLARELERLGCLEHIFTCLPWWRASKESNDQQIARDKISCNFLMQGVRRVGKKVPGYHASLDMRLGVAETQFYSRWVARNLPECDAYIGISGSGLHAGRLAKSRGAGYVMDRGSTQTRHANRVLKEESRKWNVPWNDVHPWLIENEESEAVEADLITVPSEFVKGTFIEEGTPSTKIRVVPYGVSLQEFHPCGSPPEDRFRLLFVGQFTVRKGVPYLLKAFREFKHPNKELVVVGHVPNEIRELIASIGIENVVFKGAVPRTEVKRYMSTAHALVLPSIEEGLALVQGQALACGCPVIATPNTGSENLFRDGVEGLIVEARSVSALVRAFEQLAEDPNLRRSMSESSLSRVKEFGGWADYAESMIKVFAEAKQCRGV